MSRIFKDDLTDYEKAMVRFLWNVWNHRPDKYTDASGAAMGMEITSDFDEVLGDEKRSDFPDISVQKQSNLLVKVPGFYSRTRSIYMSKTQAELLNQKLTETLNEMDGE